MGPSSRASSIRPPLDAPSRFSLMTPSASPPVHRLLSRQSGTPAPAKKRRVSRAPSVPATNARSFSVASASSSSVSPAFNFDASVDPAEELDAARRASSFRVLNVWSQLAEKYARRLDEDDIVDLEDGTIIKDYGILRSSEDDFEIGYFAKEQEDAERLEHDQPLTPADDEPDELDAFADIQDNVSRSETDGDEEDGLELAQHTKRLPPVRELDPADAADLAEFLRAEQLRRETFGDPDEEDEEDGENETEGGDEGETECSEGVDAQEELDEDDGPTDFEAHSSGDGEEVIYQESVPESDGDKSRRRDYSRYSIPSGSPEFDILDLSRSEKDVEPVIDGDTRAEEQSGAALNVNSDDELGGWDHDEGSTLYSVADFSGELADEGGRNVLKETSPYVSTNQSSKPRKKRSRANAEGKGQSDEQVADQRQSRSPLKKTGKQESGPSSPKPRPSSNRRSRSGPSTEHLPEVQPQLHHLPELNTFSFTPPHAPHFGYQNYPALHFSHPAGLSQQQHSTPLPHFQDPNAQYHLAQALQSLSILMGGALPFPSSPVHTPYAPQPPHFVPHGHHQAWPPYTPRHHNRTMNFDTPQSVASEPPPSSPLASDYSDSVPSSPTKRPFRERGRSQATSLSSKRDRPKSAIREARTRTRSRSRSSLRVSFSSPEATQIEDAAYEYVSDEVIEVKSSDEDSDMERRHLRREELSKRSSELHVRAQTPGPPDRAAKTEFVESGSRHSARRELGPKRKHSKASRSEEASRHQNGRGYR